MANFYSDLIAPAATNGTLDPNYFADASLEHGERRIKVARLTVQAGMTDSLRWMTFKSGDRLGALRIYSDGAPTAGTLTLGLFSRGTHHDGTNAAGDGDLFCTAQSMTSALTGTDLFTEAGTLGELDRWKTIWELLAIGDQSFVSDPRTYYDVRSSQPTGWDAASEVMLVAEYIAGE